MEHEIQQDIVWARFCALYLPDTVARFLDPPAVTTISDPEHAVDFRCWNVYLEMLVQIQHSPYFSKYLRSSKPTAAQGKRLPSVLAERLLDRAPRWDRLMQNEPQIFAPHYHESIASSSVQLLSTLLAAFVKQRDQEAVVPRVTRDALLPWLQTWARRYSGRNASPTGLGEVCLWAQIPKVVDITREAKTFRKAGLGWETCAMPGCGKTSDNKACAKYVLLSM
jgi:hypothetical protein